MSIRGVYQLMRLDLKYCDHSGSSRHLRNFLENHLKTLREDWSHLDITTTVRRGRHPNVTGTYRSGRQKTVDLKNKEEKQIRHHLDFLFSEKGRKSNTKMPGSGKITDTPSVQGMWRPGMWDAPGAKSAGAAS